MTMTCGKEQEAMNHPRSTDWIRLCEHMFVACASTDLRFLRSSVLSAKAHKSPRTHRVLGTHQSSGMHRIQSADDRKRVMEPANKPTGRGPNFPVERKKRRAMYERAVKELPAHHHLQALRYRLLSLPRSREAVISQKAHDLPRRRHCKISKADNPLSPPVRICVSMPSGYGITFPNVCGNPT